MTGFLNLSPLNIIGDPGVNVGQGMVASARFRENLNSVKTGWWWGGLSNQNSYWVLTDL